MRSWGFILTFSLIILVLLSLFLSCISTFRAPIIMMSQNRQEVKDSLRIENDYNINQQSIVLLDELHKKILTLKKVQKRLLELLEKNMSK